MSDRDRVDILNFNFFDWDGEALYAGGAERYVIELARLIDDLGLRPRLLQNARRPFARDYEGIEVVGVAGSATMDLDAMSAGFVPLLHDAALVIASPLQLAARLPEGMRAIGINHGIYWDYPNNRLDVHSFAQDAAIVQTVLRCIACVCVDSNFPNWLRCFDAEAAARTRRIPNFVDLTRFRPTDKRFDGRLEVLFPRRLCAERGLHEVIAAFDELLPVLPSIDLHVCGSGAAAEEAIVQAFVARHAGRVRWSQASLGEMPAVYAASHVVLVPTVSAEGTSLSFLEAMATRNAVVATAVGGLTDLAVDDWNALVVPPGKEGIVAAIARLGADRTLASRLATNALTVVTAFAKDRWRARWHEVLHDALPLQVAKPAAVRPPAIAAQGLEDQVVRLAAEGTAAREEARVQAARALASADEAAAARAAHQQLERQHEWTAGELAGIKASTGWAVLQFMYRVRFALFPRGSWRDRAGKWVMHNLRKLRRGPTASSPPSAPVVLDAEPTKAPMPATYTVVCLPILEWTFRFQRPQQLARRFAVAGHAVVFAKHSFGTSLSSRPIEPGIEEVELPGTPGSNPYRDRMSEDDAQKMADALLAHVAQRGEGRFVCIVQLPFWAPLAARLRVLSGCDVVYDCMDLHEGFSSNTVEALSDEARLFAESDLVVCSSDALVEHARPHAQAVALVRNGVDYAHFAAVPDRMPSRADRLTVGYYGAIADWFDSALVAAIAKLRPAWRLVLIGNTWSADTAPLEAAPNIVLTGEKPYAELPALIADWDCCIIPFRHTPLTNATNPVKIYEMLAAGKPVVSVGLPELAALAREDLVSLAEDGETFVAQVEREVARDDAARRAARRAFAAQNTWERRQQALAAAIDAIAPLVSIVVVTYNNRALNEQCLASILGDTDWPAFEVIVVDNASKDGTPGLLREVAARDPRVRIVLNADNKGFAAANNQGLALARGRYFCLLNNDTVVHGAWLATLIGHLRAHANVGLVGPVTNAVGNEAKIAVGYENVADMAKWADAHCAARSGTLEGISMLAFFCVALPREVWRRVGTLDERFGIGMFEDDDYNRRVSEAGYDIRLARDAFVHHWQKASFDLLGNDEYLRIYRQNEALYAAKWSRDRDPLGPLRRVAQVARATVIFAPSVGWAIQLAQRPHHLARVLAQDGYAVVFDCSNAADDVDTLREVEPRLFLYKGPPAALAGLPRTIVWTFSYNVDYRDAFGPEVALVYDWIDDLTVFPYDQRKLARLHERGLREADVVASVARPLHEAARRARPDALYVPNAVEEGRFDGAPEPNPALADPAFANVIAQGRPIAGYYGAMASWFDYAMLAQTARLRPDWSFVLIGPDFDGSAARSELDTSANVYWLGPRPYIALPGYLHRFDVASIPFAINDITLATSPLKLYEYFAAGKPVISTPMPECMAFPEVRIVRGAAEFAGALDAARADGRDATHVARLRAVAAANTWRARARDVMAAVERRRADAAASQAAVEAGTPKERVMHRFAAMADATNRRFFEAVCAHLAGCIDDPCLPMYMEFALTTNKRGREVADFIVRHVPLRGSKTLDVGCAYGGFLVAMAERGAQPMGFDIDASLLALAKQNFADVGRDLPVQLADVTRAEDVAPFADTFDVVTCNDVIEHVADPAVTIRHIASMLRPGGLAYFEIPNRDAVAFVVADGHYQLFGITQLDREAAARYYAAHAPGVRYGVEHYLRIPEYRALFEAAGLAVEVVPDPHAAGVEDIRGQLVELRRTLPEKLQSVPSGVRDEVRRAVRAFVEEAERMPTSAPAEADAFRQRYAIGFWRILARKPVVAPPKSASLATEQPAPAALAHKLFVRCT